MIKRLLRLVGRWARKPVNHTSWVAVVTPTDRPKSVRNRCLIELFCGVVCVVTLPFWHFCWCRGFCHRTESDLFLFLFLDLNIKVIGSDIHTSVDDKRDYFGFPIVNFPWLSGDVPSLPSYGIYISQLVRFARCCTNVLDFHSKNLQITSKLLTQGYRYHKLRKTFG